MMLVNKYNADYKLLNGPHLDSPLTGSAVEVGAKGKRKEKGRGGVGDKGRRRGGGVQAPLGLLRAPIAFHPTPPGSLFAGSVTCH